MDIESVFFIPTIREGVCAIVDIEDAPRFLPYRWDVSKGYARRHLGMGKRVLMHQEIMGVVPGLDIDHINRNPMDNRKSNLRFVTRSVNVLNTDTPARTASGEKNIYRMGNRWQVRYRRNNRQINAGSFKTLDEAVRARDAAISVH